MKTIRQIADDLGVSKQAVSKRLAQLPPTEVTTAANRMKLITPEGERLLRDLVATRPPTVGANQPPTSDNQVGTMIDALQEQLRVKDDQIAALTAALESTTAALNASQALHAGTIKQLGDGSEADKPPGLFSRLFGKGGGSHA